MSAAALMTVAATGLFHVDAQSQSSMPLPAIDLPKNTKVPPRAQTPAQPSTQQNPQQAAGTSANPQDSNAGKAEISRQAADLLRMATDLKAAVDKSTKDELSVAVVRKAGEIEQLAHKVRSGETARVDTKSTQGP